jgi:hypothetical protein
MMEGDAIAAGCAMLGVVLIAAAFYTFLTIAFTFAVRRRPALAEMPEGHIDH